MQLEIIEGLGKEFQHFDNAGQVVEDIINGTCDQGHGIWSDCTKVNIKIKEKNGSPLVLLYNLFLIKSPCIDWFVISRKTLEPFTIL